MDIKEKRIILIAGDSKAAIEDTARVLATAGCLVNRDGSATCTASPFRDFHAHVLAATDHASAADWALPETDKWIGRQKRFRDELVVILESLFAESAADAVAVADPLATELIPLWTSVANTFGCRLDIVFAYQRPQLAVRSLAERFGLSPLMAEALFFRHADAVAVVKHPVTIFNHGRYLDKPHTAIQLVRRLGLKTPGIEAAPTALDRSSPGQVRFRAQLVDWLLRMRAAGWLPRSAAKELVRRLCQSWPGNSRLRAQLRDEANERRQIDRRRRAAARWPNQSKTPRIAFVIPRVYGLLGTQGSYGLATAFAAMTPTLVISRVNDGSVQIPVVASSSELTMHHAVDFSLPEAAYQIAARLEGFAPDIVHFINDHSWSRMIPAFKARCPDAKFVLDLKTPLLAEGAKRRQLHKDGRRRWKVLDLVISLSRDIAQSWIPEYDGPLLEYPLGIIREQIWQRDGPVPADPSRVRFIYIGQTHPKRQLSKLLDFVSQLSLNVRGRFSLDIYGAGGGNEEIDAQIEALGLSDAVSRKTPLPQNELFRELTKYDCGIAWVPNEVFGEAPSLKFLEYAAAKLAVIATDTPAHRRNLSDGFRATLFQETADSFAAAVETIVEGKLDVSDIEQNYAVTEQHDLGWIAANILLPEYVRLSRVGQQSVTQSVRARLLFVSPRPLGLMATPGTYLSVEAYADHAEVEVIAKPKTDDDEIIVHTLRKPVRLTLIDPQDENYADKVLDRIAEFKPDLVCIASWPGWNRVAVPVREAFPNVGLMLEVKSPVVMKDKEKLARQRRAWQRDHLVLDAIIAPAKGMVNTFIENIERPFLQHRSILDYAAIGTPSASSAAGKRFVFSGSLSEFRQIDRLLFLISRLPADILNGARFDFFGDGPARESLIELSGQLGMDGVVHFHGAIPQSDLYQRYRDYDAGLAWVPKALYDSAPSLKLIEYCSAGIAPVATDSAGHLLLRDYGFVVEYFDEDDEAGFAQIICNICRNGVSAGNLMVNRKLARRSDFGRVIGEEILPFYGDILRKKTTRWADPPDPTARNDNGPN